jgi:predicted RNA-binding Zn ribbon-like protein
VSISPKPTRLLGSRLAVNFANGSRNEELNWEDLIAFLEAVRIVSAERALRLLKLPESDLAAVDSLLHKSRQLREALRTVFGEMARREKLSRGWMGPINEVLRITEGHDELVFREGAWHIEFVAREGGLDWLLAAIARSAAEIIAEGPNARLRLCANPHCGLLFYDNSRTGRRRWCSMSVCGNRNKVATFARNHQLESRAI